MATKKKVVKKTKAASSSKRKVVSAGSDFWKFEFNMNSIYWVTIGLAIITATLWIYNINQETSEIYDAVDTTTIENSAPIPRQAPAQPSN